MPPEPAAVVVDGPGLTAAEVVAVARGGAHVRLGDRAREAIARSRAVVEAAAASGTPVYGVSTGFGALATVFIPPEDRNRLQRSLVRSHAAGLGPPVETEVVRAMLLLRLRTLAMGCSGARQEIADAMVALLNAGVTPLVPEHGSLGCSGDLAPLAHAALCLIGEGAAVDAGGSQLEGTAVAQAAGFAPLDLDAKEGLALVNGTDGMLGVLLLALADARLVLAAADVAAAMSVEALLGTDRAFDADLVALRPQPGQQRAAANMRRLLAGSAIVASHRDGDPRVQDAYSLRCAPQVAGAARDAWDFVAGVCDRELEAAIDNPVVLADGRVASNGNFHGAPLALAADFLAVALAAVGAISERRTDRLLDVGRSHGLPPFLADEPGVDSGLMLAQYTAAALVAENRRLAVPASADSIPTSAMQEDHVSMGWAAARKLRVAVRNLAGIVAVEIVAAARGLDLRAPLVPAAGTATVVRRLRVDVPGGGPDRFLAPELAAAEALVLDGSLVAAAESAVGSLD
jgi:histidine ammonia-lyase